MVTMKSIAKKCAVYTRKSTEEGLDQDFNSLDAQRESCEAFITSQKSEGWQVISKIYNDGGYTGGNLDRPALKELLADIKAGRVDIVVVYKIDRLTRSLMDFSKLVEIFDEHDVTFVSVTQSFNTTTSMGRLTLNVLLSFAQFEREVTGERIRDKIAASKKKGMWMGGSVPMGYKSEDRKLVPDEEEMKTVRFVFTQYLKLGSVKFLKEKLDDLGIKTPLRIRKNGTYGGHNFSRGKLYHTLKNPIYTGMIQHKNNIYEGQHEAIINSETFLAVQEKLKRNAHEKRNGNVKSGNMLKAKLFDCEGTIYSPTYTNKKSKRYCYYISQNLIQYQNHPKGLAARIPAFEIEKAIISSLKNDLINESTIEKIYPKSNDYEINHIIKNKLTFKNEFWRKILIKAVLESHNISMEICTSTLRKLIKDNLEITLEEPLQEKLKIETRFKMRKIKNGALIIDPPENHKKDPFDLPPQKLKRIVQGTIWRDEHFSGKTIKSIATEENHCEHYVNTCIQDSFLFLVSN